MNTRKRSFNYKLVISYFVLVLIIVGLVEISSYLIFRRMYMRSQDVENNKTLRATVELYEEKIFQPLTRAYSDYLGSSELGKVGTLFFNREELDVMQIYQIHQYLKRRTITDEYIDEIHLYAPEYERMLSSRFGYKSGEEAKKKIQQYPIDFETLDGMSYPIVTKPFQYDGTNTYYYNVVYSSSLKPGRDTGYVIFTLNAEKIEQLIHTDEDRRNYILDKDGTILCSPDVSEIGQTSNYQFNQSEGYEVYTEKNKVISSMVSSVDSLYFVTESSIDVFYPVVRELISQTFVITAVMLLIGGAVAFGISRHMSRSVEQIVNRIRKTLQGTSEEKQDLEEIVNAICDEFQSLDQFIEHSKETIKNNYIQNLYLNRTKNIREMDGKRAYIGFSGEQTYVPALFYCGLKEEASTEAGQMAVYKYLVQLQKNSRNLQVIASEPEENIIAVLYHGENLREFTSLLTQVAVEAGSRAAVYIGSLCRHDEELGRVFQKLQEMLLYRFFYPHQQIWEEASFCMASEKISVEGISEISRYVKSGKMEACMELVEHIVEEMDRLSMNYEGRQEILLKLISAVSDPARAMGIRLETVKLVIEAQDIEAFLKSYKVLLKEFEEASAMKQQQYRQEEIDVIKRFIAENYDKDISLSAVAESVHMTSSYVSRFFKEQTGQNVTEYIKEVKLAEAEKLLRSTDHSVEKIAGMIGYNTTHYFIKQFKEKYGETPTVYRKKQNMK